MSDLDASTITAAAKFMSTRDGAQIRYVHVEPKNPSQENKTIVILPGRASFLEKYTEVIHEFSNAGFQTWALDWRGQGGSTRFINHPQKIYIDTYDTYLKDLHQLVIKKVKKSAKGPILFFSSSMGGTISLRFCQDYPKIFSGGILVAPMLALKTSPLPLWAVEHITRHMNRCGLGKMYVLGYGDYNANQDPFEKNQSTHDRSRFERQRRLILEHPKLVSAGPTFRWLQASLEALDKLSQPNRLKAIRIPLLVIQGGQDSVVDTSNDRKICEQIRQCDLKTYPDAKHGIHIETDIIRQRLWNDINEFMRTNFGSI